MRQLRSNSTDDIGLYFAHQIKLCAYYYYYYYVMHAVQADQRRSCRALKS